MNNNNKIKVILLGETGVGKSSLIKVAMGHDFNESEEITIVNSFLEKTIDINNEQYKIQIWDTIGQEQYRHLTKLFFNDSKIVILVYDKSSKDTFDKLNEWNEELKKVLNNDEIILAVVGNKDDLEEEKEDVDENKAREYAKNINAKFIMASAKTNGGGFSSFLKDLMTDYIEKLGGNIIQKDTVVLNKQIIEKKKSKFKC